MCTMFHSPVPYTRILHAPKFLRIKLEMTAWTPLFGLLIALNNTYRSQRYDNGRTEGY